MGGLFKDNWRSYWKAGFLPVPADPESKRNILGDECQNWERYFNEVIVRDWEDQYPDFNITVLLVHDQFIIDTFGPFTTEIVLKLPFPEHPICFFGKGRSRHFFNGSGFRIGNNTRKFIGKAVIKTGSTLGKKIVERIDIVGCGVVKHVPPTVSLETQLPFFWNPAPWEVDMPRLDLSLLRKKNKLFNIAFNPDW